ncbi:hypothetical protein JN27_04400 [Massilia sp. BSC265]|nr:hypothetical protein JN27_04400 [Massilia sp. BSC265]
MVELLKDQEADLLERVALALLFVQRSRVLYLNDRSYHLARAPDRACSKYYRIKAPILVDEDFLATLLHVAGSGTIDRAFLEWIVTAVESGMMDKVVERSTLNFCQCKAGQPLRRGIHVHAALSLIHDK